MTEPIWLERRWVDALHFQQLARFGGLHGVRDEGAIESALARAQKQWEHGGESDIHRLAAAYAFGLARNHGYSDGNKRIAFVAMAVFLDLNGWDLVSDEVDVVRTVLALAAGELDEGALTGWIHLHAHRVSHDAER